MRKLEKNKSCHVTLDQMLINFVKKQVQPLKL